jgi:hypothetical protein
MTARHATRLLESARAGIRQALTEWNAVELSQIYRANANIEAAISALREFRSSLETGTMNLAGDARSLLAELQRDTARMTRVVDACLAFECGLLLRLDNATSGYGATGGLVDSPCSAAGHGLEA